MSKKLAKVETLDLSDKDLALLTEADVVQALWSLYARYSDQADVARGREQKERVAAAEQNMEACESLIRRLVEFLP